MKRLGAGKALVICACLVAGIAIVYGQTLGFGFVVFDDALFVTEEPHVSGGLTWAGIKWAFAKGTVGNWCPLSTLSHMTDCQLFGLDARWHHFTSLLLHAASAVTLFLVLWRMTGGLWPSAFVAAVFAVHPLHVESVAWIAERRDVLSGLFFVLTLGAYSFYVDRPNLKRYLAVATLLALGLMAKSMLVTLPALLLLLDYWPLERSGLGWRRLVVEKLPLVGLSLAAIGVTLLNRQSKMPNPVLALPDRLANAAASYAAYLGQMFVPVDLSVFYPYPAFGWPLWQIILVSALLLAITIAAVLLRRKAPYFFVGWFWYVGMLLPVVQIIPFGTGARADHFTYLSQIGLTIALVWGAIQLAAKWPARDWAFPVGSAAILMALAACAFRQVGVWQGPVTLWRHAIACDPGNVMAHYQLALAYRQSDPGRSKAECLRAFELPIGKGNLYYGARARACSLLGYLAANTGNTTEGQRWLEQSVAIYPDDARPHIVLGRLLVDQGQFREAAVHFQKWVELEPNNPYASESLAMALEKAARQWNRILDAPGPSSK